MIDKSLRTNTLLHRKVMRLEKGKKTVVISALRELNPTWQQAEQGQVKDPRESAMSVKTNKSKTSNLSKSRFEE